MLLRFGHKRYELTGILISKWTLYQKESMNESYFFAWILANDQWNHSNLKQKYPPEVFYKKKLHEKVSQCSQENTYVEVSFQ